MKVKLIFLAVLLSGCSMAGIKVVETENSCTLSGALFDNESIELSQPEVTPLIIDSTYTYSYTGTNCTVTVGN